MNGVLNVTTFIKFTYGLFYFILNHLAMHMKNMTLRALNKLCHTTKTLRLCKNLSVKY
jgi:hypothetical protein